MIPAPIPATMITSWNVAAFHRAGQHRMAILSAYLKGYAQGLFLETLRFNREDKSATVFFSSLLKCQSDHTRNIEANLRMLPWTRISVEQGAHLLILYGKLDRTDEEIRLIRKKAASIGFDPDQGDESPCFSRLHAEVSVTYSRCPIGIPTDIVGYPENLPAIDHFGFTLPS